MLSSNMISWEYITAILAFCNHCIFFSRSFVYITFFSGCSAMRTEERTMNTEQWINLKFLIRLWKTPSQAFEILQPRVFFLVEQEIQRVVEGKRDPKSGKPLTSRTEVNVEQTRQVVCGDRRSAVRITANQLDMKKDCLEDYHWKFGRVWKWQD